MDTKFTLALIILGGIGMFALPSTVALFTGQHSFYNIDATGNQVPCIKCHGDVKAELSSGGSITTGTGGPHTSFKCEYCHRAESGFASGDSAYAKITYSDASDGKIYLVTTIYNFENGNFPKAITYQDGMTVDNWAGNVWDLQGNAFIPINGTETGTSNGTNYSGSLSTNGVADNVYNYSYSSEVATGTSTGPKDADPDTATTAFNARAVTWSGSTENLTGAGSKMITPGTKYHVASLVSCLECHGGDQNKGVAGYQINTSEPYNHAGWLVDPTDPNSKCSNCHYGDVPGTGSFEVDFAAGGFGLTVNANDTGSVEAHNDFVRAPGGVMRYGYGAANDACVACHTHVAVDITFQKRYVLKFNANAYQGGAYQNDSNGTTARTGAWDVGGYSAQGTVSVEEFGNQTGGAFATGNHSYNWTPSSTLYIGDSNGTLDTLDGQVTGLNNDTNDSTGALTSP